ncbi:hypothetical protein JXR93_12945 [bacterium]|nr:hypothetical protein [bacterium]
MEQQYLEELEELYKLGDLDLIRYLKNNPKSIAFYPLAKRLFSKKKYEESIRIAQNGVLYFPKFIEPLYLIGKGYIKLGNRVKAIDIFKEAIKIDPFRADSYYYISEVLFSENMIEKGKILLLKAYELNPEGADIKNSFQKHFKKAEQTDATINIEQTLVTSIKELDPSGTFRAEIQAESKKIDDEFFAGLEKEFVYGKSKKYILLVFILALFSIAGYTIFSVFVSERKQKQTEYYNGLIYNMNNRFDLTILKNEKSDIGDYYKTLYYYEENPDYFKDIALKTDILKAKTKYQYLQKMVYYLYEGFNYEFDSLYNELKIKYDETPDIFLMNGLRLLKENDTINATNQFYTAYKKSKKELRFKKWLAFFYFTQNNLTKIIELFNDEQPDLESKLIFKLSLNSEEGFNFFIDNIDKIGNKGEKKRVFIMFLYFCKKNGKSCDKLSISDESSIRNTLYDRFLEKVKKF